VGNNSFGENIFDKGENMKKEGMTCVSCGKIAKKAQLRFQGYDIDGWKCSCGEEYFDPEQAHRFLLVNKVLHKEYEVKLGQIRSNLILRIPAELANALKFEKGEKVLIKVDDMKRFHVEAVA
jgi:hypothetical protein